jgi:hypothetical protein
MEHIMIQNLINYLEKQDLLIQIHKENVSFWYSLDTVPDRQGRFLKELSTVYFNIYHGEIFPVYQNDDDLICLYKGKYLWIHLCSPGWERRGEYNTPEEVWENKIKKDIDYYNA